MKEALPASQAHHLQSSWDEFWFAPQSSVQLRRVQQLTYAVAAIWFLTILTGNDFWWGKNGMGSAKISAQLESLTEGSFGSSFRISPLWLTDSYPIIATWCVVGILLAVASATNYGGRMLRLCLMLWILFLAQRFSHSAGLLEPYLVSLTGYLAIARMSDTNDWSHGLATRLIQVHTWLLLAASLASQLSYDAWWQGETIWWLAISGGSTLIDASWLEGHELLVNLFTHSITLATVIAVGCYWPMGKSSPWRYRIGQAAGICVALAYALAANHVLYGCLLAICLSGRFSRSHH